MRDAIMTMLPMPRRQNNMIDSEVTVLNISTAHVPETVMDDLAEGGHWASLVTWTLGDHDGVLCHIPDNVNSWAGAAYELPRELFNVLRCGYDRGCLYVWLHPDAPEIDDLPVWDW